MNLGMDILRIISIRAIRGRTWAGDRVFDSPANPADLRIVEERAPFVAVFTDDGDFGDDETPTAFSLDNGKVWLIIEAGTATAVEVDQQGSPVHRNELGQAINATGVVIPEDQVGVTTTLQETDAATEMQIGFLGQQVVSALQATDSPWADLWRLHTAGELYKVEVRRGGVMPGTEGVRFASRLLRMHVGVTATPPQGAAIPDEGFWRKFLDLCAVEADLAPLGRLIEAHLRLTTGDILVDWREAQKILGVPEDTIRALGIAPEVTPEDAQHTLHRIETNDDTGTQGRLVTEQDELPPPRPTWPYPDMG